MNGNGYNTNRSSIGTNRSLMNTLRVLDRDAHRVLRTDDADDTNDHGLALKFFEEYQVKQKR
jgi:hypothetical protein